MQSRLVDDWLNNVNEKRLQVPFCQALTATGHTVLHLSRHGEMEQGRDVIAVHPDGAACSYQLKSLMGGRLTQTQWHGGVREQARTLVYLRATHPALPHGAKHRPVLVLNGMLDEPVRAEIAQLNLQWESEGLPRLEVLVQGHLIALFENAIGDFWPTEPLSLKALLELYLAEGTACLPKPRMAPLVEQMVMRDESTGKRQAERSVSAAALMVSYALSSFADQGNHYAIVEGWGILIAATVAIVTRSELEAGACSGSIKLAEMAVHDALAALADELAARKDLSEGNVLIDGEFYRERITILVGLMSLLILWPDLANGDARAVARDFIRKHMNEMVLWGEGAIPSFLAFNWAHKRISGSLDGERQLCALLMALVFSPRNSYIVMDEHLLGRFGPTEGCRVLVPVAQIVV